VKIVLAGYNVEVDVLKNHKALQEEILSPEIFSSAYARISRSSKDIVTLRKEAGDDVKKARKSNKTIIFEMGHHSVAEHAVFNFDIIGVSRLALEEIERFRLASYTEKSQRYVTLKGDYVLPGEIKDPGDQDLFCEIIELQNDFYKKSLPVLQDYNFTKFPELSKKEKGRVLLKNLAKEDARYILSLASEGQVGLTINARNLEHLFRRFNLSSREELRQVGKKMYDLVYEVAPSIFLFAEPSEFEKELRDSFKNNFRLPTLGRRRPKSIATKLTRYTKNGDEIILASFLSIYNSIEYDKAYEIITRKTAPEKESIFRNLFESMAFFDSPPREFEMADITFQAVISASNFAQLKRHRMATLISGEYDIDFGNRVPEVIKINGLEEKFAKIIEATNKAYLELKERYDKAADYILTNSHRRMVIMKMNLREVYHFIRLRDDAHAQWEIREMAGEILRGVKQVMPYSAMLLCGKSNFDEKFKKVFPKKQDTES
jgi:flavin-dependent thymidylate synthase